MVINKLLNQIPFFWTFSEEEKNFILESDSYFESFEKGDFIIHEGAEDSNLYVILKGRAAVTKNSHPEKEIAILEDGTVMGELSFLTQRPRSTNVVALEKTICFSLDGKTMAEMGVYLQHKVKDQLIEILVRRLDEMNQTLLGMLR